MERLEDRLAPAVIQWDGGPTEAGTNFNDPVNWLGDVLPGPSDDAVVGPAFAGQAITSGSASIHSLDCAASLTVDSSGPFAVAGAISVGGTFQMMNFANLTGGTIAAGTTLLAAGTLNGVTVDGTVAVTGNAQLAVDNGMTLNGRLLIGDAVSGGVVFFNGATTTLGGTGSVVFGSSPNIQQLSGGVGSAFTITSGITVRGQNGYMFASSDNGTLVLQGVVASDVAGGQITVMNAWTNQGTFRATGGGTLELQGTGTWAPAARLSVDAGSAAQLDGTLDLSGASLASGGTVNLGYSGTLKNGTVAAGTTLLAAGTLNGVTVDGTVAVTGNAQLAVNNGMTLNGRLLIGDAVSGGVVSFNGVTTTLGGAGSVVFGSSSNNQQLNGGVGSAFTITSGITVRGKNGLMSASPVNGTLVLQGVVASDVAGGQITVMNAWTNQGTFRATGGGTLELQGTGTWAPAARLSVDAGSAAQLDGTLDLSGASLASGGTVNLGFLGTLKNGTVAASTRLGFPVGGGILDGMTIDGAQTDTSITGFTVRNGMTLNGVITLIGSGISFQGPSQSVGGTGSVVFQGMLASIVSAFGTGVVTFGPGVTLHGNQGIVTAAAGASWVNQGTIAADVADGSITLSGTWTNAGTLKAVGGGVVNLVGSYTFADGSTLAVDPAPSFFSYQGDAAPAGNFAFVFLGVGAHVVNGLGSAANPDPVEVQQADVGNVVSGYPAATVRDSYRITGGAYVKLVDTQDNATGTGPEAIYTDQLTVDAGATLDLNGLHLYARAAQLDGTVLNGSVTVLPDSGPLTLNAATPGSIAVAGELDEWTFLGHAGQAVAVTANPGTTGADAPLAPALGYADVRVLDAAGNVLASAVSPTAGGVVTLPNIVLSTDGTYRVQVRAAAGHTGNTGNYVVTVSDATVITAPLTLNALTTGTLHSQFDTDRWTFSAPAGTLIQFDWVNASTAGLQFQLAGPNGYIGFTGLTGNSGPITLPATGTYALTLTTGGVPGSVAFRVVQASVTDLALGTPWSDTLAGEGSALLYRLHLTDIAQLRVVLDDSTNTDHNELYVRYGLPPDRADYDYRYSTLASADQQILVPAAAPGDWYVLVYGAIVPSASPFTITASTAGVILSGSVPDHAGNAADAQLSVTGAGFVPGTIVALVGPDGTAHPLPTVTIDSMTALRVTVPAGLLPPGTYALRVTVPGGATTQLDGAFREVAGGQSQLKTNLIVPDVVGNHTLATLYIQYSNVGTVAMPAPLLLLSASRPNPDGSGQLVQGAFLTLDQSRIIQGLWTSALPDGFSTSIQILASGATPGVLQPGESVRVPVYYAGWLIDQWNFNDPSIDFNLGVLKADDPTGVDWTALKSSLQPTGISNIQWDALYPGITAGFGSTWGGYVSRLDADAAYLGTLGESVTDIGRLFAFEVEKADGLGPVAQLASAVDASEPAPGLSLAFGRTFTAALLGRSQMGRFGLGWSDSWDTSLTVDTDGTVTVAGPAGSQRRFQPDSRDVGTYFAQPGDHGTLTWNNDSSFTLQETDGTVTKYRADGTLDYVQDANGNRITAGYANGRLTTLTHSSGQKLTLTYNAAGLVSAITDDIGRTTTFTYDAANQHLLTATNYDGTSTSYTYATGTPQVVGALLSVANPDGTHQFFTYDANSRLTGTNRDGGAEAVTLTYGSGGDVTATDATGGTTVYSFNDRGLLVKVTDALGRAVHFTFDDQFNLTRVTDPLGQTTFNSYDANGNLTRTTDPLRHTTAFAYTDSLNRLAKVTDANGHAMTYGYDGSGNLTSTTYEDGSVERLAYDPIGEVLTSTNRRGDPIDYTYDAAGRVTRKSYSDGTHVDYVYDAHGNLTSATDATGTTTLTYDSKDRLTKLTYPGGHFLSYSYDAAGRRTQMVDQDGFTVNYRYNAVGRLAQLTDGAGANVVTYTYDAAGRLQREDKGNGTFTTYQYDAAGELLHLVNSAPDSTVNSRFDYTYDTLGRRVTENTIDGDWVYGYDATGQLTHAVFTSTNPAIANQDLTYVYDAVGNRTQTIINGVTTPYTTNALNQYTQVGGTTYTYDADGNMVSQTDATSTTTYTYNAENRLTGITTPGSTDAYQYDAFGNRVSATHNGVRTDFLIDPTGLGNVVGMYSGAAATKYTYGLGLVNQTNAGVAAYYDFNAIGSTAAMTGISGIAINRYTYSPFGKILALTESLTNPFQENGQIGASVDSREMSNLRARDYNNALGRFVSPDPAGIRTEETNLYVYAVNSPNNYVDPTGNFPTISPSSIGGAVGFTATLVLDPNHDPGDAAVGTAVGLALPEVPTAGSAAVIALKNPRQFVSGIQALQRQGATGIPEYVADPHEAKYNNQVMRDVFGFQSNQIPEPPARNAVSVNGRIVTSQDPNDLIGPAGVGAGNFVTGDGSFPYRIDFENDPTATAPAQAVTVRNQLDPNLDWNTFELTGVGFGDTILTIPPGSQSYQTTVTRTINGKSVQVQIRIAFSATGLLTATFQSLDPATLLPPDVLTGFLPAEDGTGRGQGFITYIVNPKSGLPSGTAIRNVAIITFDGNAPIATDQKKPHDPSQGIDPAKQALVTIDATPPTATVNPLPATEPTATFPVSWSGSDGAGSGIASYDVFASDNGGPFTAWLTGTPQTTASYPGQNGHNYRFYAVATDAVGRRETTSGTAEATTTVSVSVPPPPPAAGSPGLVGYPQFAVGFGAGGSPTVRFFNPDASQRSAAIVFDSFFTGGVRTASADFTGDGVADYVAGTGPGSATEVAVYDGATGQQLFRVAPFEAAFIGGVYVAAGDVDGDGKPELIVTPDEGGGPRVQIYRGTDFTKVVDFFGIDDPNFRGGARAAIGDVTGDGAGDLVISAGFGGGPRISIYDGRALTQQNQLVHPVSDFFLFEPALRNGAFVAVGDIDGDGFADVVGGGGPGGGPRVYVLSGKELLAGRETPLANFFAGNTDNRGGIRVAVKNLDGDAKADLVVGDGTGAGSRVTAYRGKDFAGGSAPEAFAFDAAPGFTGGVFVG